MGRTAALPILTAEPGFTHYLGEIRWFPILERQEEYMLGKRWREHGDRNAAHKLITSPSAARDQDRQGLSRLRPANLRGQYLRKQLRMREMDSSFHYSCSVSCIRSVSIRCDSS